MEKENNKSGRPSKYESHVLPYLSRIPKMKQSGMTDKQIAFKLGIAISVFKEYKNLYPDLTAALKSGRMELIEDLEDTLYRKALGKIVIKKTKKYIEKDKSGKERTRIEEIMEEIPPDTGALVFALKNIDPEHWKDKREYEGIDSSKNELMEDINKLITSFKKEEM